MADERTTGTLFVTGLGPGAPDLITPRAQAALARASVIAGYEGYLSLVPRELLAGKTVLGTGMTREIERCRMAFDAAVNGSDTALVCSGDPGVYALASLVFELAITLPLVPEIEIVPGVPALAAAAARLGAPLGHDFAVVSLSDALTPREVIEKRLRHALLGDFVLVLYNPRSRKRPDMLERALALAREIRGEGCLAGVARLVQRPGETTWITTVGQIDPQGIDMLSLVMLGSAATYCYDGRMITPRGYTDKYGSSLRECAVSHGRTN